MNNTFRIMAVLATAAAVLASCAKAEIDSPAGENADGSNVYQGPVKTLTFTAQTGAPQTKTSLGDVVTDDGNKTQSVLWDEKDNIKIMFMVDGTEYSVTATAKSVDGSSAVFEAEVPESGVENYYAVYPATVEATVNADGSFKVTIPESTGTFKSANIMVAKTSATGLLLSFKHAVGIVKFQLGDNSFKSNREIHRLSIFSGVRDYLRGDVLCSFGEDDSFTAERLETNRGRYSSAYKLPAESVAYVAVWPDYTFENGFVASYFNEQRCAYYEKDVTVARGEILDIGNIQEKMRTDFFIKPGANGDGSSWENAAGEDFIRAFFAQKEVDDHAYIHCMKCENTNFWFSEGTYYLGTASAPKLDLYWGNAPKGKSVPINFYGGCPATSSGTDKTRDPKTHETVFSGNSKYGILSVRNKAALTLDGITLKDAVATNVLLGIDGFYGAALYVAMNTGVDNKGEEFYPIVNINNCKFVDNKEQESINSNYGCGSAINLATGKVYVDNTLFSGNISYNRGMIHTAAENVQAGTCLFINNCCFTGNGLTSSQYGSVIRSLNVNTKIAINNCSFGKNTAKGGAPVTINSPCVFVNNTLIHDCKNIDRKGAGIYRMTGTSHNEAVLANNIIMDESNNENTFYWASGNSQFKSLLNLCGPQASMEFGCTMTDLSDNTAGSKTTKTGLMTTNLGELTWADGYYWTWNGTVTGVDNWSFTPATATQMIAATKANSKIGDDFYNWLVQIGAIVNGQFTDCRGYLRPKDAMCPGAYDPNATQPTLQ